MTVLTTTKTWKRAHLATLRRPDLTAEEIANVKRALRFMRIRCGGARQLAHFLGMTPKALACAPYRKPSVALALRLARCARVPLEEVLAGRWPVDGACPHCGRL